MEQEQYRDLAVVRTRHGGVGDKRKIRLDFSTNCNPLGTSPAALQAIQQAAAALDSYPEPLYCKLRESIGLKVGLSALEVNVGNGATSLLYSWFRCIGDVPVVIPEPTFSEYRAAALTAGRTVIPYAMRQEDGFQISADFLDFLRSQKGVAVVLCNPNNPSGTLMNQQVFQNLLRLCGKTIRHLLIDESFLELSDGRSESLFSVRLCPQLYVLRALTKSHGLAGVRFGYGITTDPRLSTDIMYDQPTWSVSTLAVAAATAALKDNAWPAKAREIIVPERQRLTQELTALGMQVIPSQSNFLLFQGPAWLQEKVRTKGILMRDCSDLPGLKRGWCRIAVRKPEENEELLNAIRTVLEEKKLKKGK